MFIGFSKSYQKTNDYVTFDFERNSKSVSSLSLKITSRRKKKVARQTFKVNAL